MDTGQEGMLLSTRDIRFYHGRSMAGTFRPGDCLTVVPIGLADVRPGDVVVYRGWDYQEDPTELVHRIVAVVPEGLRTRGDSNPCLDTTLVTQDNLLGQVTYVERSGKMRLVHHGRIGLLRARVIHARLVILRLVKQVGRGPYCWLRGRSFVVSCWRPKITKVALQSKEGYLVKYICSGRTVARYWPTTGRFECRKPFDLVIPRPEKA